ncbi:MAG: OmpH family outer membrane protein [Flavobacteriales bacterium]|nr:OmpH family outer membrane protein [Flavobacteriales bacterium]
MIKPLPTILVIWNIALTGLCGWLMMRQPTSPDAIAEAVHDPSVAPAPSMADSAGLNRARIAFFRMDSLRLGYELIKEKDQRYITEGRRLEAGLQAEQAKARERYQQLMQKDQTYSTKAEVERDEAELRGLMEKLQGMQVEGEERLARMEGEMLKEIAKELEDYLKEFNAGAGHDYIFSVQGGGQIWVGNEGLDITQQLVDGLNARHRARKAANK